MDRFLEASRKSAVALSIMSGATPIDRFNALAKAKNWQTQADSRLSFRDPDLVRLISVWKWPTPSAALPTRTELTARFLKPFLRNLVFTEIATDPSGAKRFRHTYMGTAVTARVGERTGRTYEEFLSADDANQWSSVMAAVDDEKRAVRIVTRSFLGLGDHVLAEMFAAPLAKDGSTPDKLMSVTYFSTMENLPLAADIARS